MNKIEDIRIRDPFILVDNACYFLYGTRSETAWSDADGFDVYKSTDFINWEGPKEIFHRPKDFWATDSFWAPECIKLGTEYYLIATFGSKTRKKGIEILKSSSPEGPFDSITGGPITSDEWNCLDGTVYFEESVPYLIFSHSVPEESRGAICAIRLKNDLAGTDGELKTLFYASDARWSKPIPFAKDEFGMEGEAFFSDGPFVIKEIDGTLKMLWSSWGEKGYAMGLSRSLSGNLKGPWEHGDKEYIKGGGHGMVFKGLDGCRYLTYHTPNDAGKEHPTFIHFEG